MIETEQLMRVKKYAKKDSLLKCKLLRTQSAVKS